MLVTVSFLLETMSKYKLLSIPIFLLAVIIAISGIMTILKRLSQPLKSGDAVYLISNSIGYYATCALFLWFSYWLFKKSRQFWNRELERDNK